MVTNKIYHGITIGNIPLGGLTPQEAEDRLNSSFQALSNQPVITLEHQGTTWPIRVQDIDLRIDASALAKQAFSVGRTGNIFYQLKERYLTINRGYHIPLAVAYNNEKLNTIILEIAKSLDRPPQNASLIYDESQISVIPETIGLKLDTKKLSAEISNQLNRELISSMPLPITELPPSIRNPDLSHIDGLIASYSTQFNSNDMNRSQNILLAAKSIQGTLVKAGEEFSFNNNVGPRLAQNGYKEAPVFIEGKLVPDFGGGVCQVSSTLYNAVLLADMAIVERTPHFRPPVYVPLGQDATVADNLLDFRFKNSTPFNIYITSEIVGNQLTISVYGKTQAIGPTIKIVASDQRTLEPNTIIKQDPALEQGKQLVEVEGQKGFLVTTYRVRTSSNGQEVSREFLAADEFKPVDYIIRVGTKSPRPTK
jgi:vancomycin resistance protein YoaR